MPHISIKMLGVLTNEQKRTAADKMAAALCEVIDCSPDHVSVSIEEYGIENINSEHSTITLKMLEGRTDEQKRDAAQKLAETFYQATELRYEVEIMVIDYTPQEWQEVYAEDIEGNEDNIFHRPNYDPKDLLK